MKLRRLLAVLPALGGAALCLALVVSIFAITVPIYLETPSVAEITIANRSSEMIVGGAVEALGMSHPLSNIAAGERTTVSFPINGEGSYSVRAQLASGRTVDGGERYIASGFSVNDSVNVTND